MKLVAQVRLLPTAEQAAVLLATLERCNEVCDWISQQAWEARTFGQFPLHRLAYRQAREQFGLYAQAVVRALAKVAHAYRLDRSKQRRFHRRGAFAFDDRMLT